MYNPKITEPKWQKFWEENNTFRTLSPTEAGNRPKKFVLSMFPYPSGEGLHVGHAKIYTATDVYARFCKTRGYNVLHPTGWDAFGLPAENYAIKTGTHPAVTTAKNVANYTRQMKSLGLSYDWSREINTTDVDYIKQTQWIFLQLFERGLAYEQDLPINYCPSCKTGLANEEVVGDNTCDRCGSTVERRKIRQWVLKITEYAERLLADIDTLDWPESIKDMQRNWIGKSEGVEFSMKKVGDETKSLSVYTTRIDTVYGMTYVVLAADHTDVANWITPEQQEKCEKYIADSKVKSDLERTNEGKEKTGEFTGSYVINPFNGEQIPVWIGDYVLGSYGTGAVMAVPAHDERDFQFAKKMGLKIRQSVDVDVEFSDDVWKPEYANDGGVIAMRWGENLMRSDEARNNFSELAEKEGFGKKKTNYKLRDWLFSRQRYWGEPIPLIHLAMEDMKQLPHISDISEATDTSLAYILKRDEVVGECTKGALCHGKVRELMIGGKVVSKIYDGLYGKIICDYKLPLELPEVQNYEPAGDGDSPL
ncbi:MAG: leucine--tRNA ligase, partial [Candidatus Gracilibacteria bacterium]|nr:leucine--tRNA ligase [Candidatus Gracilibacteria bacterium]